MSEETRSVAAEIGQRRPFPSRAQELIVTVLRTTDEVRRHLSSLMEAEGITLQQYNVLRILRGAGDEGLPTLEIARRMVERQPGVTRLVDRLVAKELVERARCPEDRRRVLCTIRPEGLDVLTRMDARMRTVDATLNEALGDAELTELIRLLDRLRAAARSDADEPGG